MKKLIDPLIKIFSALVQALISEPDSPRQFNTRYLIFVLVLVLSTLIFFVYMEDAEAGELYLDIGAGIRLDSTQIYGPEYENWRDSRGPTAFLALGYETGDWRFEIAHSSNWFIGAPFDRDPELHLTEFRIVKRFSLLKR